MFKHIFIFFSFSFSLSHSRSPFNKLFYSIPIPNFSVNINKINKQRHTGACAAGGGNSVFCDDITIIKTWKRRIFWRKKKNLIARNQLNYVSATRLIIAFVYVFLGELKNWGKKNKPTNERACLTFGSFPTRFFLFGYVLTSNIYLFGFDSILCVLFCSSATLLKIISIGKSKCQ